MKDELQIVESKSTTAFSHNSLVGFYFAGQKFNDLLLITQKTNSNLSLENNHISSLPSVKNKRIQSARWLGFLKPEITGDYTFSSPSNQDMIIQIDNHIIVMGQKFTLTGGQSYKIRIECCFHKTDNPLTDCQLLWSTSNMKEFIPQQCLLSPDYKSTEFYPQISLFGDVNDDTTDTDNDGIIDDWEINGYTYNGTSVVQWDSSYAGTYTKYVSNPQQASTASDPYTDLEKVTGQMDLATSLEARNPFVAAYPKVGVIMEKLILSENVDYTNSQENSTSNSKTEANTSNASIDGGAEGKKFVGHITQGFSHTTSTTNTTENSNTAQVHINTVDSAYINANVRYFNTGSAPIYQVTPTNNFTLDGDTIMTILAQPAYIGNSLTPGETYPDASMSPIAITEVGAGKDFTIPYNSFMKLQSGEQMMIETTQISGNVQDSSQSWTGFFTDIEARTACIILDTGDEVLERRIAARNYNDSLDCTPEITLGDAIQIAFLTTIDGNKQFYKNIPICEELIQMIYDQDTADDFKNQLNNDPSKKMFDLLLKQDMNILIKTPSVSFDCNGSASVTSNGISWSGASHQDSIGIEGGCLKGTNATGTLNPLLAPYSKYVLSLYVKAINENTSIEMGVMNNDNNHKRYDNFTLATDWQRFDFEFSVLDDATIANKIYVNSNNGDIYLDDITITKFESLTSNITEQAVQKAHTVDNWEKTSDGTKIKALYLKLNPEYICDYEVIVDGKNYGTGTRYETSDDGTQKVNFTEYNAGNYFNIGSRIQVNAIYKNNSNVKAIVALWYNQQNINVQSWQRLIMNGTIYFYDNGDPGSEIEPYGWLKFYPTDIDIQGSNEVSIWNKPNDGANLEKAPITNLEFYAPDSYNYTFYGDVKEDDSTSADDVLVDPNDKKTTGSGVNEVTFHGPDYEDDYVTIDFTVTYP
nr:Vip-like4 [Bacillus thuringiensis]